MQGVEQLQCLQLEMLEIHQDTLISWNPRDFPLRNLLMRKIMIIEETLGPVVSNKSEGLNHQIVSHIFFINILT